MIRNPYLWSVFRLILSLKSSKLRIFSLKSLIFKLKYIGFQERNRDVTIITHAFRTFKSVVEIDYLEIHNMKITPIEIKSGTQGGMKSLWLFMREKKLTEAFRCSLENFGSFDYIDKQDDDAIRHVTILPLYALSLLRSR